jgi:adenosylcobinamide-phosphate synthase
MEVSASVLAAPLVVLLDQLCGEPRRFHPLVGFGWLAGQVENRVYGPSGLPPAARRRRGILAVVVLLAPALALALPVAQIPYAGPLASVAGLYLALGARSLREHAEAVRQALEAGDLVEARQAVGRIVSRDTRQSDEPAIAAATVESVLENGCDAVFGALFWFVLGGLPGVVVYRLSNTLDAMWGYRNEHYRDFGWTAARLDDVLNYLPARLTAFSYALCGHLPGALCAWRRQGRRWKSPNAGPVMAAGAGALRVRLGGPAIYHGVRTRRPVLGFGRPAQTGDIARALRLVQRALLLWLAVLLMGRYALA